MFGGFKPDIPAFSPTHREFKHATNEESHFLTLLSAGQYICMYICLYDISFADAFGHWGSPGTSGFDIQRWGDWGKWKTLGQLRSV